ncbi:MAG: hypothetical protein NT137_03635 [Methanomassiliicoccales archaeon]|nr:hypothetical protein [Methanomassiliicoccales archaeon]
MNEMTELEHIELKMIDGMPIDYWRGVEDAIDLVSELLFSCSRGKPLDVDAFDRKLEELMIAARDRRTIWLGKMMFAFSGPAPTDSTATSPSGASRTWSRRPRA